MIPTTALFALVTFTVGVLADTDHIHGGFISMCEPKTVRICSTQAERAAGQTFLCASCYNDNTKILDTAVASKLGLDRCLANNLGALTWRNDGNFERGGCSNCLIASGKNSEFTLNLQCHCKDTRGGPGAVVPIDRAVMNLNQGIHVHNGQLVCFENEGTQVLGGI